MFSARPTVVAIISGYNLIQNLVLSSSMYVPVNIVLGAGLVALARRNGSSWADLGLDPARAADGLRLGAGVAGVVGVGALLGALHPGVRPQLLDERAADQEAPDVLYNTLVRFPLGTALFEEVAFRGVVEAIWRQDGGTERDAGRAAAMLFGLWHLVPTRAALSGNPATTDLRTDASRAVGVAAGAIVTGIASLGLSWMRRRSDSLVASWLAHTAVSSAGYLASVAAWRHQSRNQPELFHE